MVDKEWTVTQAVNHFDELLEQVITRRQPISITNGRRNAVLISMEEWESIQENLISRATSDL